MRGVSKKIQKLLFGSVIITLAFQGVGAGVQVAYAQTAGPGSPAAAVDSTAQKASQSQGQSLSAADQAVETSCGVNFFCHLKRFTLWVLQIIRDIVYLLLVAPAGTAFMWVVDPSNISGPSGILNLPAIYTLWQFIRDFFNLFFIFILLFSAFATIFQVDSFNIRNIFKSILLAALLINFSFPITRFLIDATNVPMYYFINDVIGGGTGQGGVIAMNNYLAYSGIPKGVLATSYTEAFSSIIFAFLFGISLLVLAVMMIIRLIALTLLLVFSPIGFASSLLPGLSKYGQEWWSKFWSYALFGPAAALMLVVSLKFMESVRDGGVWRSMSQVATNTTVNGVQSSNLTDVIFFTIPIITIWFTIGLANKFSLAGAATVVGAGYGAANWARKKATKAAMGVTGVSYLKNRATDAYDSYKDKRDAARKDAKARNWATRFGSKAGTKQNEFVAQHGSQRASEDARSRIDLDNEKKVAEEREKSKKTEASVGDLHTMASNQNTDKNQRAAAAQLLAEKGMLDVTKPAGKAMVAAVRRDFGETGTVFKQMNNKIRQYDPVSAFENITKKADGTALSVDERSERMKDYINSNEFDAKKVGANSYGNEEFVRTIIEEGAVSMKDLEEASKKSAEHKDNINRSLKTMAETTGTYIDPSTGAPASVVWNRGDKRHKAIQEAHFNMNGKLSAAVTGDADWTKEVFGKLSKDFGSNVKEADIVTAGHVPALAASVNPNNYKGWLTSIKDKDTARVINKEIINMPSGGNDNIEALKRIISEDSFLKGLK